MINTQISIPGYQVSEQLYNSSKTLVYRGFRATDQKPVAIKLLKNPYPSFNELVQFRNQYTIAKNLNFPGIIQTISLEAYENGYILVMEDFGGISLKDYFANNVTILQEFLQIAISLCDTLDILSRQKIIHKDIKPANILINPDTKEVKLIDFSIASLLPRETQEIKNLNVLEGTLTYISPEQTGRMNRGIDYRTDFYSLGVSFYELLTGELPFPSNDPIELVHCHIAKIPTPVSDIQSEIPRVIGEIISKLMAKNAEDRYQSALGIKHDLEKCLSQLEETGKIAYFEIAQRDICDRFIIPDKLYGREREVGTLLSSFERVSLGATEMMLVAGFSGIGKTAVVNEVHKPIVRQRGYFIKGKYDQFQRNIPFSAFVQAFRDLMGQLLTESDAQIQAWKNKILAVVGENGQVIIEVIPELEIIIGKQPPATELSGTAAQNRFNLLFQKFTQLFTNTEHPLVIFLDDLQWADLASLKLIELLMANTKHLFLIGAYRDNEVNPAHPLMLTLSEMQKTQTTINTITLAPLNQEQTNQLVADTLKCPEDSVSILSKLVFQKTQGNPFFTTQFLKALHQDGLIEFNFESGYWQCEITQIQQQAVTDDVVAFMALQLRRLPLSTQKLLQLAACIGNQFDLETLVIVSESLSTETATYLWTALQSGLILPISDVYKFYQSDESRKWEVEHEISHKEVAQYKFLHDRVQQAAYSLIPDEQKQATHYQIGQLLLQKISPEAREERIFELVNQLNYGTDLISEQTERDELAQLNLIACRKAKSATAYQAGREYASIGLSLLGEDSWQQQYNMTLLFHEYAAELAMLCGEFAVMEQLIETVINQAHSLPEKVNVYRIKILTNISQNKPIEAIEIGIQILHQLGVVIPAKPTLEDIQQSIQEISNLIGKRKIADFVYLSTITDVNKIAIIQIVNSMIIPAYTSGSPLFPLLTSLAVKLSLQYGNISASAFSYGYHSITVYNFLQNIDLALEFNQLALNVALKFDDKVTKRAALLILGVFILHHKYHIKETLSILTESYAIALEVGNLQMAGQSSHFFCLNSFWCGQPLPMLEQDTATYYNALLQLNQLATANYCRIYWQSILNLQGFSEHPTILSGSALQETECLALLLSANDLFGLYIFYLYKLTLCFLFEELEPANNHALKGRNYLIGAMGTIVEPAFYFYDSLIALAPLSQVSAELSIALERVAQNQTKLQYHAHDAHMNHQHRLDLVAAEKCRVLGQKAAAIEFYDKAISGAKANEYIQEEALANELAAKFYIDWGKEKVAAAYIQYAYYCYTRWGAKAKIIDLETRYPHLLVPILQQPKPSFNFIETLPNTNARHFDTQASSSIISDMLDFASVIKAAQVLSSEIKLDELIQQLTQIILQNSGGDKCILVLPQNETWYVRAISTLLTTELCCEPLENHPHVPIKLIQYVRRMQGVVVINNLETDLPVIDDYLRERQPKSVLCLPILNQRHLAGIIYLKNRSTSGVFTSDRIMILNFLCTQAAISLENARLYERSQDYSQQLELALQDLQQAQFQMIQSEKMSALGNLVAGVAHEMNNPLGFISASLQQAKPNFALIVEHLKLYEQTFPNPGDVILTHAEEINLDYTLEDLPKMIDSMSIACDRLENISTSLRTFSRSDKAYKVPFNIHQGIDSTILILKHRLKANHSRPAIEVIYQYGNLPKIECFPGQLNQVFMNILANAIDALEESNSGRSLAEIKANPNLIKIITLRENKQVKIIIADNGKGMNQEVQQKIFDHLFTTKVVGKGTGLGLAIAKQIVEETHGGKLSCSSVVGQGTEFVIEIPI